MKNIPINSFKVEVPLAQLFLANGVEVKQDWEFTKLDFSFKAFIGFCPQKFYFGAQVETSPWFLEEESDGKFVEGLWQHDVVELFVGSPNSSRYLELNLSPGGAWWCCWFADYRSKVSEKSAIYLQPEVSSTIKTGSWQVGLKFDLVDIGIDADELMVAKMNVCAILGEDPRRFVCSNPLSKIAPDFHRPESRIPVVVLDSNRLNYRP